MKPFAAALLAMGLPIMAATDKPQTFRAGTGSDDSNPFFTPAIIPQECVRPNGHMGCSRQGQRICIYMDTILGRTREKKLAGMCNRRKYVGLTTPQVVPQVFARAPAAVPAPEDDAITRTATVTTAFTSLSTTSSPTSSTTSSSSSMPSHKPHPKPQKPLGPITAQKCAAVRGRRLCYKDRQICLYKDSSTEKTITRLARGFCKSRSRPVHHQPGTPDHNLPRPGQNNHHNPGPQQPWRPGGHHNFNTTTHPAPRLHHRREEPVVDANSALSSTGHFHTAAVPPSQPANLGGRDTTETDSMAPIRNPIIVDPSGVGPKPGNYTNTPNAECVALKGITSCFAGQQTCIYRNGSGQVQIKRLHKTCPWRIGGPFWRKSPVVE